MNTNFQAIIIIALVLGILGGCSRENKLYWEEETGYRWAELNPGFWGDSGFEKLDEQKSGITFRNLVSEEQIIENQVFLNGSGVTVGDINGNGLPDIYFASLEGPNKLYKNLGNYRFVDITDKAGVAHEGYHSTGVVFADVNGNGHLDLLIASLNKENSLYINDGKGNFELKEDSGLSKSNGAKSLALADINGNGYLDLYITNYKKKSAKDIFGLENLSLNHTTSLVDGEYQLMPPYDQHFALIPQKDGSQPELREIGHEDEFYLNNGDGTFNKVNDLKNTFLNSNGEEFGLHPDWGLVAQFQDLNDNGLPDLYVVNDFFTPDRIWINQGNGQFKLIDDLAIRNSSFSSMGVDFSDINRKGSTDIFVSEMLSPYHHRRMTQHVSTDPNPTPLREFDNRPMYSRNSLFLNRSDNTYAEIAYYSQLEASGWSWAVQFLDINLNGYEDLIITTGFAYDVLDLDTQRYINHKISTNPDDLYGYVTEYPSLELQNKFFQNNQDLTFSDKSSDWGFKEMDITHGLALADLNNNGTLDLITNRFNDSAAIYTNRSNNPRIAIRLKGNPPNTQGIGAKIKLEGGPVTQTKELAAGGNYLSGSTAQATFAADRNNNHVITVTWPGGHQSVIENVEANRIYEIEEPKGNARDATPMHKIDINDPDGYRVKFEDVSEKLDHHHIEDHFDEYELQPLLPYKLSRSGPGAAWIDFNQNGKDDLLLSSGKGGNFSLYENLGNGEFSLHEVEPLTNTTLNDQTSVIGWHEGDFTKIVVGNSNYKTDNINAPSAYIYSIDKSGNIEEETLPGIASATGPIAAADYNGNGYIDLFIGGRFIKGSYPMDADSRLFMNDHGTFRLDEANSKQLSEIGLVTSAVFSDINNNGSQDLLISTEWGSLRLFKNNGGTFKEITTEVGLDQYKGWWNGIATGDFTNNGLTDIVATNKGLNSSYQIRSNYPLRMFYGDFNWNGTLDIIEAYYDTESNNYVPRRQSNDLLSISSVILQNIRSHSEYGQSSLEEILGYNLNSIPNKEINTLEHMMFINTGNGFKANPLPPKAQFSAGFYIGVADFDNDGNEDLFISQNYFGFPKTTPRLDSGRGLILKGDGQGKLQTVPGQKSGITVYGEQRGAALSDFNNDGKVDIAITQNNNKTKLYKNRTNKSGIKIRLKGPYSNKSAIGSSIRIVYKDGTKGPKREIQAGSGYWSQNSSTQVMGFSDTPASIDVHWFDNNKQTIDFIDGKLHYTITHPDNGN